MPTPLRRALPLLGLSLLLSACQPPAAEAANRSPAAAQKSATQEPAAQEEPIPQFPNLPGRPDDYEGPIYAAAPAYAGLWTDGSTPEPHPLFIAVASDDPAAQQAAYRAVLNNREDDLKAQGIDVEHPQFVRVRYSGAELSQARALAWGFSGWTSIGSGFTRDNRVKVSLSLPDHLAAAKALMARHGVPEDIIEFEVPEPLPELPTDTFAPPHTARLDVPAEVALGDVLPMTFTVTNTGEEPFDVQQNLCGSLKWQVVRAEDGAVVRPQPTGGVCATFAASATVKPGETLDVIAGAPHSRRLWWDLKTPLGERVEPGEYILQMSLDDIRPQDVRFRVTAAAPDGGAADALEKLWPLQGTVNEPDGEGEFVVDSGGMQLLHITVPDALAQRTFERRAGERGVSLARVRFRHLPTPPLPPAGDAAQATLTVSEQGDSYSRGYGLDLKPDIPAAKTLLAGAQACELIFTVQDAAGELVDWTRVAEFSRDVVKPGESPYAPCPSGNDLRFGLGSHWDGELSSGEFAPAGHYTVRAGLRVIDAGGQEHWLSAAPSALEVGAAPKGE
ncbi:hypothetical protein ACFP81_03480 [Deinococcus lacus]|uniref:Uncharacterized protein n=1 Tax=Deinococcus lacus TaxID=392561 RepID=A0ABW1YD61_9DEIO